MGWKIGSMFNRFWWPDFCHQWILLYFYISNFSHHHGSSLLVRSFSDSRAKNLVINKSLWKNMNHTAWIINMNHLSALGTFALLAETSFLCVCLMDKEWYRNFLERVNFGHFRKAIFYTVAPLLLLIICSIILYHMGYIFATVLFIAGSVCNFIIHRRVN